MAKPQQIDRRPQQQQFFLSAPFENGCISAKFIGDSFMRTVPRSLLTFALRTDQLVQTMAGQNSHSLDSGVKNMLLNDLPTFLCEFRLREVSLVSKDLKGSFSRIANGGNGAILTRDNGGVVTKSGATNNVCKLAFHRKLFVIQVSKFGLFEREADSRHLDVARGGPDTSRNHLCLSKRSSFVRADVSDGSQSLNSSKLSDKSALFRHGADTKRHGEGNDSD
jgi:hypothetical protein